VLYYLHYTIFDVELFALQTGFGTVSQPTISNYLC
jgi:hypothetical protein